MHDDDERISAHHSSWRDEKDCIRRYIIAQEKVQVMY